MNLIVVKSGELRKGGIVAPGTGFIGFPPLFGTGYRFGVVVNFVMPEGGGIYISRIVAPGASVIRVIALFHTGCRFGFVGNLVVPKCGNLLVGAVSATGAGIIGFPADVDTGCRLGIVMNLIVVKSGEFRIGGITATGAGFVSVPPLFGTGYRFGVVMNFVMPEGGEFHIGGIAACAGVIGVPADLRAGRCFFCVMGQCVPGCGQRFRFGGKAVFANAELFPVCGAGGFQDGLFCPAMSGFAVGCGAAGMGALFPMVVGVLLPRTGEVMPQGVNRLHVRGRAFGTGKGFHACHGAGGRGGDFTVVPSVSGFWLGHIATGTFFPMVGSVTLPCAAREVVTEGIHRFRFGFIAGGAGKGFHACHGAGGCGGDLAVVPRVIVNFRRITVKRGIAPGNGADVSAVFQRRGVQRFVGLTAQLGVCHITRHGGGKGEIHIIRAAAHCPFGSDLHRILTICGSRESIIIVCACERGRTAARTGNTDACEVEITAVDVTYAVQFQHIARRHMQGECFQRHGGAVTCLCGIIPFFPPLRVIESIRRCPLVCYRDVAPLRSPPLIIGGAVCADGVTVAFRGLPRDGTFR